MSWSTGLTAPAATFVAAPGLAQEASTSGGVQQLEEVVVTAEKRSELLSKAPLAISTVNQQNMDELGITSAQQLVTTVPNFQISANGYTPQRLSIRGIGNFSGSYSTVAVQVDGIYEPNTAVLTNGLYERYRMPLSVRVPFGLLSHDCVCNELSPTIPVGKPALMMTSHQLSHSPTAATGYRGGGVSGNTRLPAPGNLCAGNRHELRAGLEEPPARALPRPEPRPVQYGIQEHAGERH